MIFKTRFYLIFTLIILSATSSAMAQKWEGWRGLDKQGNSQSNNHVTEWSSTKNIKWKVELEGEGHSSPVVFKEFVFISSAEKTTGGSKLNTIIVYLLLFIVILIITYSLKIIIGSLRGDNVSKKVLFHTFLISLCLGLIIFVFATMHWNYFHEKSKMTDRLIVNWFFSGSSVMFLFILTILSLRGKKFVKPIFSLAIIPFVYFLVKNRPYPAYYGLETILKYHNIGNSTLFVQSVYLPIIAIIIFIIVSFLPKTERIEKTSSLKRSSILFLNTLFFITGIIGVFIAPLITLAKIAYRKNINGGSTSIGVSEIFDFTYPYFLVAISLGFIIIFLFQIKQVEISKIGWKWTFPLSFFFVVIFFIISNYSSNELLYERYIICFNRQTGDQIWKTKGLKGPAIGGSNYNSQATPTPIIKNDRIYAYFGSAGMMCVDFSGKLIWINTDLPYTCIHGVGASPIKSSAGIIVCNATPKSPYITTIDTTTGESLWTKKLPSSGTDHGEYRTPTLININNKESILEWNFSKNELRFYNTETGDINFCFKTKWRRRGESIVSPIISSDTLFLIDRLSIHALSISKILNKEKPMIWSTSLKGKGSNTSSPVKVDNRIFIISDNGYVTCIDSKNGTLIWKDRIKGLFYSSIVSSGKYVYFTDTKCITTVIQNSDKFEIVAQNELNEELSSTIAIVDNQLFIRTNKSFWCIGK